MKARVLKDFIDKNTGKLNKAGEVIEVNKTRYAELRKAGKYVVEVEAPAEEETKVAQEEAAEEAKEEK